MWLGKNCMADILHFRDVIAFSPSEHAIETLKRDWPRSWERLLELAK